MWLYSGCTVVFFFLIFLRAIGLTTIVAYFLVQVLSLVSCKHAYSLNTENYVIFKLEAVFCSLYCCMPGLIFINPVSGPHSYGHFVVTLELFIIFSCVHCWLSSRNNYSYNFTVLGLGFFYSQYSFSRRLHSETLSRGCLLCHWFTSLFQGTSFKVGM